MRKTKTDKTKYRPSIIIVLGIVLVAAIVSQLAFLSIFGTRGKEVAALRSEQREVILENEMLEAQISKKQSLVRIKKIAKNQLGMSKVSKVEYIDSSSIAEKK